LWDRLSIARITTGGNINPSLHKGTDSLDRLACLRHKARIQLPDMWHSGPDLDLYVTTCGAQFLSHSHGIVE